MNNRGSSTGNIDWSEGIYPASADRGPVQADINPGILIFSLGGRALYCNQAAVDLLGRSQNEILEDASMAILSDVVDKDGRAFAVGDHPVWKAIRTGNPSRNVVMGLPRPTGGNLLWLEVSADPLIAREDGISRVICTLRDISVSKDLKLEWILHHGNQPRHDHDMLAGGAAIGVREEAVADILSPGIERKRVEESLAINREITNQILESCADCIKILDLEGNLLYMNPGAARTLEIDNLSALIGKDWTSLYFGADRMAARAAVVTARAGGRGTMQGRFSSKSGRVSWWDVVITPITNTEGAIEKLLAVSRDVTASKRAEEELRLALEEVRRLKDQLHRENVYLQEEIKLEHNFEEIVGETETIKRVLYKVEQVAPLDTTVLILGETGSGKELVARAIHSLSARKDRPLVKVNCAALPASLIESELFGHERGAFTDAHSRKIGRFELANGGTIFLDEVGELPLDLQAKLLRVLQDGEFERLGSSVTLKVDTRILAATNRDLKTEMREGRFRGDLWYRLSVFPITVPPLRERKEDIPLLVRSFASKLAKKLGKSVKPPSLGILAKLQGYAWPGNVRELANVVERAIIDARGETLDFGDGFEHSASSSSYEVGRSLEEFERGFIIETLRRVGDKIEGKNGAARSLGLNPSTLRTRMKKLGIQRTRGSGSS